MKKNLPDFYVENIFKLPVRFFTNLGIKYVLCDLDNTLDAYDEYVPSSRVVHLKNKLNEEDIELIIISNNKGNRVASYANKLGVRYLSSTRKPFGFKLRKFIKDNNLKFEECILIGDQLVTDVPCGKNTGIKVILTDPIVKKDQWTTRFNRLIDRPKRKRLIKKGIISHMKEEDYEQ